MSKGEESPEKVLHESLALALDDDSFRYNIAIIIYSEFIKKMEFTKGGTYESFLPIEKSTRMSLSDENTVEEQLERSKNRILRLADLSEKLRQSFNKDKIDRTSIDGSYKNIRDLEQKSVSNEAEFVALNKRLDEMQRSINLLDETNRSLKELLFDNVSSYKSDLTHQLIPVNIFLDSDQPNLIYNAYQSILDFLADIGFENSIDFPAKKGSWIKKFIGKSKQILSSEEVTNRLKEVEYSVEVNTILKPQSEVEKNQSEALLNILKGLEGIPNAAIRIGSLIIIKLTNKEGELSVQTRTLSIRELHYINKHPELLENPRQILFALSSIMGDGKSE